MDNKNFTYSKETLINKYNKHNFPQDKINKDALTHKDFLFSNNSEIPTVKSNFSEISPEFYHESHNKHNNPKNYTNNNNNAYNNNNNNAYNNNNNYNNKHRDNKKHSGKNEWRKIEDIVIPEEKSVSTLTSHTPVSNTEFKVSPQNKDEKIEKPETGKSKKLKLNTKELFKGYVGTDAPYTQGLIHGTTNLGGTTNPKSPNNITPTVRTPNKKVDSDIMQEYFQNEIKKVMSLNSIEKLEKTKQMFTFDKNAVPITTTTTINQEFNLDCFATILEKLKVNEDDYLFYILHPQANSSYGPLSTNELKEMIKLKVLTQESEIRFIDIYNLKGLKPFQFFKIKLILEDNFLNQIEPSSLISQTEVLKPKNDMAEHIDCFVKGFPASGNELSKEFSFSFKKDEDISNVKAKEEFVDKKEFSQPTAKSKFDFGIKKPIDVKVINEEIKEKVIDTKISNNSVNNNEFNDVISSTQPDLFVENYNEYCKKPSVNKKKKGKKPVDANIKLGNYFYNYN